MSSFDDRKKVAEAKFMHDEEKLFKIQARARKFLGLWAGEKMHLNEERDLEYAIELVKFGVGNVSQNEIVQKVKGDIAAAGAEVSEDEIKEKFAQTTEKSVKSLEKEGEI